MGTKLSVYDTDSIDVYFQKIKQIRDKLAAVLLVLDDEDILYVALDGLPLEYDSSSLAIRTCSDVLTVEELNTLLNAEERAIQKRFGVSDVTTIAIVANYQPQGFGRGRGRGRNNNQRGHGNRGRGSSSGLGGGYNPNGSFNNNTFSSPYNQSQPSSSRPPGS